MSKRHGFLLLAASVICAAAMIIATASCTTTIRPPAHPETPATVYLLEHGKSSSLVLPGNDDHASRWAFGDWRYYALNQTSWRNALIAVLWPTRSALGRQMIEPAPETTEEVLRRIGIGVRKILPITVEREAAVRLERRLQDLFNANRDSRLFNPSPRLEFVDYPEPYTLINSSNRKVAAWLRELGCEVSGVALQSRWQVVESESSSETPEPRP
ncbi:MAG: DUF2459 domain-containing protein [Acidobacteria bacterium]|nr:DUF2459 domain-containing protein [Acidobacteriota bacterium]